MAFPPPVSHIFLRYVPRFEHPSHPMEGIGHIAVGELLEREPDRQSRPLVHLAGADEHRVPHLRPKGHLLLRSGQTRVLPPCPSQLLLCSLDRLPVLGAGRAAVGDGDAACCCLVRPHGSHLLPRAQDLWAVDVGRPTQAVQGGQPFQPFVHRRELRRRVGGRLPGAQRRSHLLLRRWIGTLHGPICYPVPEASYQQDPPQGAAPCFLPVRCCAQCRLHGLGKDQR